MIRRPPRSTRTDTLFPYTTLFRSSPAPRRSLKSLEAGLALYPHFRRHISLSGPVTAAQVQAISEATGLKERQIRTLAARFRVHPVAETLAPKPRGPAVGSHRIDPEVRAAIETLIDEIALKMVPPSRAEAARQIWGLLHADNGDHRFPADLIPSEKTIERLLAEIPRDRKHTSDLQSLMRISYAVFCLKK